MPDFKFKVGDFVYVKTGVTDAMTHAKCGRFALPFAFMVVGRYQEECYGGYQATYKISGQGHIGTALEIELIDDYDIGALMDVLLAAKDKYEKPNESTPT